MYRKLLLWLSLLLTLLGAVAAGAADPAVNEPAVNKPAAQKLAAKKTKTRRTAARESAPREPAAAEPAAKEKELSGISIVGNDEAPKSLYIVPWKSSEIGGDTSLSMMLNEQAVPVDREVFMRQLDFYEISTKK